MKLTYVYHSGFVLETDRCVMVFDYYKDPAGVVGKVLSGDKKVYVFVSHYHYDHFNPLIFEWKKRHPDIFYILSSDILEHGCADRKDADEWMAKGDTFCDNAISVRACGSTDSGVSFLVDVGGRTVFHAGDLNNWHWQDESTPEEAAKAERWYLRELGYVARLALHIDVAMFPVDARLGSDYMRGARQFVQTIPTDVFIPMHFTANGFASANAFAPTAEANGCRFVNITADGQQILLP